MKNPLIRIDRPPAALRALAFAMHVLRGRTDVQAPKLHPWPGKLVSPDLIGAAGAEIAAYAVVHLASVPVTVVK